MRKNIVMTNLTPNEKGYSLHGETPAEIRIEDDGVWIRASGESKVPWRFIEWSEIWINASPTK